MGISFQNKSYDRHTEHFKSYAAGGEHAALAAQWHDGGTVDAWRHLRMYRLLDAVLQAFPGSHWLTVGDGRFGSDAQYLIQQGCPTIASDISEYLLEEAKELGLIDQYRVENCEDLSLSDEAVDFILCKDAYHHCPRPNIALYEMLRVAREGVVLIEPQDSYSSRRPLHRVYLWLKSVVKRTLGRDPNAHIFEESGNYAYKLSKREVEKLCIGLDFGVICFRGLNDAYLDGAGQEPLNARGPILRKIKAWIFIQDLLCKLRVIDHGYLAALIFKKEPTESTRSLLREHGWEIVDLPRNPYISR